MKMFRMVVPAVAVLSMCSASLALGNGSSPNGKPFVSINGQLVEVEGAVTSLQEQLDSLVARVETIDERVGANEAAIVELEEGNVALEQLLEEISNLDEINSIVSQIENNRDLIYALQHQIDLINEKLQLKQDLISGVCPDGSAIREILDNGSVTCAGFNGDGSASGQLQSVQSFSNSRYFSPGSYAYVYANCPDGYTATSAGFSGVDGWTIVQNFTGLNSDKVNYGYLYARNDQSYSDFVTSVATCTRIAP